MVETITRQITMAEEACINCGLPFMVPDYFKRQCQREGRKRSFWCPSCGKSMVYSQSEADRLRAELASEHDRAAYWSRQYDQERDRHQTTEHRRRAAAGQLTKFRKRVSGGVCPCCNRSFQDLHRHMTTKHPDFAAQAEP